MAKSYSVKSSDFGSIVASQEFMPINAPMQVGDQFYIPRKNQLIILGTLVPESTDENGRIWPERQAGQYMPVIRVIDGVPMEITNLYVGQLFKMDIKRRLAFQNDLTNAFRKGSEAFKDFICDKILEVKDSKDIDDRTWDPTKNRWKRDDNGDLVPSPKTAFEFVAKRHNFTPEVSQKCETMMQEYYDNVLKLEITDAE